MYVLDSRDALADAVHDARGKLPPPYVLACAADTADVIGAGIHRGEQLFDLLGRVLQICIERDHPLAARALEARDDRHVLAVVRVEVHDAGDIGPAEIQVLQHRRRPIAAAVVDEDHLVRHLERIERGVEAFGERR